ncbi:MAG TPA: hypothetical protein VKB12_10990 [Pyrinomonadaceae bacterium]|nr:hypothetical protein [Pyrinomonadaceae bacterium]
MRKTLFAILPLVVFLGPTYARLSTFFGLSFAPAAVRVEPDYLRSPNPAAERVRARVQKARRVLEKLPADTKETLDTVTLAVGDSDGGVRTLTVSKEEFLKKGNALTLPSSDGEPLRLTVVRPNYVNTAVRVSDASGRELQPLAVRYPVEKGGALKEVAYYTSAHPSVESPEIVRAGRDYVHEKLNAAVARLASKGERISPEVVDIAERLCVVEHTDHKRFKNEASAPIFEEVRALYALNSGDTYRYSVSSAGAGGMVQMIPPTYKAIREQFPRAELKEDFVEGMRDHSNALDAMLLYMQDTWGYLSKQEEVASALASGTATQAELLAAGYNSNPRRLPKYLREGGDGWRALIPEETKMYLRIYSSVEASIDFKNRS